MAGDKVTLSKLLENLYGVRTSEQENPVTTSIGTAATRLLANNPNRVSVVIFNLSANSIYIGLTNGVSSTNGIYIAPNGGSISLQWDKDFMLTTREFFAIATGAASSVYVLENFIY